MERTNTKGQIIIPKEEKVVTLLQIIKRGSSYNVRLSLSELYNYVPWEYFGDRKTLSNMIRNMVFALNFEIGLEEWDTLYILGDILDRGPHPIKVLLKLMEMPNVCCLVGNHELMAIECLEFLCEEITEDSIGKIDSKMLDNLLTWQGNGSATTMEEFRGLDAEMKQAAIAFLKESLIYEELLVNGKAYLLVHAGLGNYSPEKDIEDYSLKELVWDRADYETQYFKDAYVVTGHTPTQLIEGHDRPGYIYRKNNHIAIDCGAHFPGGRLAAICLDTGEEFYSSVKE